MRKFYRLFFLFLMTAAVLVIDILTTSNVKITVFYFVPLIIATYNHTYRAGTVFAVLASAANVIVILADKHTIDSLAIINTLVLLLTYGLVVGLIALYKKSQEKIGSEMKSKELIIKDIHHRMKNQLASLQSLLNLAADKTEALNVINTYAVLYDLLCYRSDNQEDVDLCLYVRTILRYIGDTMAPKQDAFGFQVNDAAIQLSSKVGLNVGLIINELATNSIKHVQGRVHLTVSIERSDTALLVRYADNGRNFVKSKFENSQGVGYIIIQSLVDQMQGKMTIHDAANASVEIVIPVKKPGQA